ncbi:MAG: phosphatidate cytidylyltransferase [Burkholderiaceae bacterium]
MLAKRVVTALVLLALILPTLFLLPPVAWAALTLVFVLVGVSEWLTISGHPRHAWPVAIVLALPGLAFLAWGGVLPARLEVAILALAVLFWLLIAPLWLARVRPGRAASLLGPLLLAACWIGLLRLREEGVLPLLAAMAIVWLADIGAYFVGKAVGRRKLAPRISPGKSIEGALGGMMLVIVAGLFAAAAPVMADTVMARLVASLGPWGAAGVLAFVVAFSIVGDLFESLIKRHAGVKDSGWILPGHGGVLDRIDALLPTIPLLALIHIWMAP